MIEVVTETKYDDGQERGVAPGLNIRGQLFLEGFPGLNKELCNITEFRQEGENDCEKNDKDYRKILNIFFVIFEKEYDFKGLVGMKSKIYIYSFYNYLTMNMERLKQKVPEEFEKAFSLIKGGGHIFLCYLLNISLNQGLIQLDDKITLQASGFISGRPQEMINLIEYYKKLSFNIVNLDKFKEDLEENSVPMWTTVKKFLNTCDDSKINEKFKKSLQDNFGTYVKSI